MSRAMPVPAVLVGLALVAGPTLAGCKQKATASATPPPSTTATTTTTPSPTPSTTPISAAPTLCELIIEINTSAGYMANKTYDPHGPTAPELEKIVNLVILRENEIVTAATAAGLATPEHVVLGFYHAMAESAASDPGFYDDYVAGKRSALQELGSRMSDPAEFAKQQKRLAQYQRTTCGITIPG